MASNSEELNKIKREAEELKKAALEAKRKMSKLKSIMIEKSP